MKKIIPLLIILLFILNFSCKIEEKDTPVLVQSKNNTSFTFRFLDNEETRKLLSDSLIYSSNCKVSIKTVENKPGLEIKTNKEFSDAFIDLKKLFGHTINFKEARFISMSLLVPEKSWISALKLNFKDSLGNFGGCPEIANNFYGNYNRWFDIVVDMKKLTPNFKNWHGDENPLSNTSLVSLNPYNAHQADSSVIYINNISLTNTKPSGDYLTSLVMPVDSVQNIPFKIDFDDPAFLRQLMAYRSFESSYQAMSKNVAGNKTMAIRLKGNSENKNIAFLPILNKVTGHPVDFTKVKRIYFSYFITEDSDDFDGMWLYHTSEHWNDILLDKKFCSEYKKGVWEKVSIDIDDLNLEQIKGDDPVLPNVYELRINVNYFPEKKNIEMWIDDFGWE